MDFLDRLEAIIDSYGITKSQFFAKINKSPSSFTNMRKRDSIPSGETLMEIKTNFTDVNLNWLFSGKGEMRCSFSEDSTSESINRQLEIINKQSARIQSLDDTVEKFKSQVVKLEMERTLLFKTIKKFFDEEDSGGENSEILNTA